MDRVVSEVRRFFSDRGLLQTPGAAAVSGGADSVALLRALAEADVGPVRVVHFNHKTRGDESDADAAFVEDLARTLGVAFHRFDAGEGVWTGNNFEAAAREWRYGTLAAVAHEQGLRWVATGHTADDQAETVLHRLVRGAGIQGLRGVAPVRPLQQGPDREGGFVHKPSLTAGPLLVRPLLSVTRSEILDYLTTLQQLFRTDSSNSDPRFTRNRVRHELLPLLKTFNPDVVAILAQTAEQSEDLFEFLRHEAEELRTRAELPRAGRVLVFDVAAMVKAPPHRVRDLFRLVYEREGWPRDAMTHAHWKRLAALTEGDYPDGVTLKAKGKVVQLARSE